MRLGRPGRLEPETGHSPATMARPRPVRPVAGETSWLARTRPRAVVYALSVAAARIRATGDARC
jgi:hypothetical protein